MHGKYFIYIYCFATHSRAQDNTEPHPKVNGLLLNIPPFHYVDDFPGVDDLTWPRIGMLCAMLFFKKIRELMFAAD